MSYSFDGVDDVISLAVLAGSQKFSIFAWIKPTTVGEGGYWGGVILNQGAGFYGRLSLFLSQNNRLFLWAHNAVDTGQWTTNDSTVSMGVWQSVGVVLDASGPSQQPVFYINGMPVARVLIAGASAAMSSDPQQGFIGNNGDGSRTFSGLIGELAVWNELRSAADMATLHWLGPLAIPSVVLYAPLDRGVGLQDLSASRATLTATGGPVFAENPPLRCAGRTH